MENNRRKYGTQLEYRYSYQYIIKISLFVNDECLSQDSPYH